MTLAPDLCLPQAVGEGAERRKRLLRKQERYVFIYFVPREMTNVT